MVGLGGGGRGLVWLFEVGGWREGVGGRGGGKRFERTFITCGEEVCHLGRELQSVGCSFRFPKG